MHVAGFKPECGTHALRLLPVIDFSYSFRCERCGGTANLGWHGQTAGMSAEQVGHYCAELIGKVTGGEFEYAGTVPDGRTFMQATADRLDELGLTWPWMCPEECGCRLFTDDADKRECGCEGKCTGEEDDAKAQP